MGMQGKGFARVYWHDAYSPSPLCYGGTSRAPLQAIHSLGMECDANDPLENPSD
jgi:hypothetical protein